ncbi:flagellar assembly protein FliH [Nitrobacteraceae bacterium AZCC 1564]
MGAPAKFLFDVDFAAPAQDPNAAKEHVLTAEEIAKQVADAEARGYRAGFDAAQHEAKLLSDRQMAQALAGIESSVATIAKNFAAVENRMETEAVEVALAVARKLCAELMAAEPLTEVTALVSDCFRHLTSTPHIVVRINDSLYDSARERIEQLARRNGFEGRLVILAEPDIPTGDCKIEWADGGVTLDREAIETKINELVVRYLASRNGGQS